MSSFLRQNQTFVLNEIHVSSSYSFTERYKVDLLVYIIENVEHKNSLLYKTHCIFQVLCVLNSSLPLRVLGTTSDSSRTVADCLCLKYLSSSTAWSKSKARSFYQNNTSVYFIEWLLLFSCFGFLKTPSFNIQTALKGLILE